MDKIYELMMEDNKSWLPISSFKIPFKVEHPYGDTSIQYIETIGSQLIAIDRRHIVVDMNKNTWICFKKNFTCDERYFYRIIFYEIFGNLILLLNHICEQQKINAPFAQTTREKEFNNPLMRYTFMEEYFKQTDKVNNLNETITNFYNENKFDEEFVLKNKEFMSINKEYNSFDEFVEKIEEYQCKMVTENIKTIDAGSSLSEDAFSEEKLILKNANNIQNNNLCINPIMMESFIRKDVAKGDNYLYITNKYVKEIILPMPLTYVNWCVYSASPFNLLRGLMCGKKSINEILELDPLTLLKDIDDIRKQKKSYVKFIDPKSHPLEFSSWTVKNMINAINAINLDDQIIMKYKNIIRDIIRDITKDLSLEIDNKEQINEFLEEISNNTETYKKILNSQVGVRVTPAMIKIIGKYCLFMRKCMENSGILESYKELYDKREINGGSYEKKYLKYKMKYLQLREQL